ncbi:unnamed protein product [Oncorhynchus mykiss]|uniref:t-SNARE coiled-coil homology domain-containing protein n=1 Tax=Oncorhynchus mykiss TaxID=8022 RepID=A0A060VTN8_ONCMY|nr:unnamed protein product [Oncorhynchus mykiss]
MTQVEEVRRQIDKISSEVDEVRKRHSMILSAPNPDQKMKDELDRLTNEITSNANSVRLNLKWNLPKDDVSNRASVDFRIQKTQHTVLSRKFVDVMTQYETQGEKQLKDPETAGDNCKETMAETHVLFIWMLSLHLSIEKLVTWPVAGSWLCCIVIVDHRLYILYSLGWKGLHDPGTCLVKVFSFLIILDSQITRQAENEIESRHQDIINLESSIRELHAMFMDMAMLVENQGDMVNNIEKNVSNAAEYIGRAKEETKKALRY